jgi:hypothetical protein
VSPVLLDRALERTAGFLERRGGAGALIARAEIGRAAEEDEGEATRLIRERLDKQAADGSFGGNLARTAQTLMEMRDVSEAAGLGEVAPGVGRALDWLRRRQGQPGRWSDGCSPDRHAAGLCHHFLGGFFSPAAPDAALEPLELSCGIEVESDGDIRFVSSCLALRALWRWSSHAPDAGLHLDGVLRAMEQPEAPVVRLSPETALEGLATLLAAPAPPDAALQRAARDLEDLATRQLGDGSWGNVDVFHALDVLLRGLEQGVAIDAAARALGRSARLLASAQQPDGSWGSEGAERRALLGWRAMRWAADRGMDPS